LTRFGGLPASSVAAPSLLRFLEVKPKAAREGERGLLPIFRRDIMKAPLVGGEALTLWLNSN
jgi:hypothetical protein